MWRTFQVMKLKTRQNQFNLTHEVMKLILPKMILLFQKTVFKQNMSTGV